MGVGVLVLIVSNHSLREKNPGKPDEDAGSDSQDFSDERFPD
jgi:hypothetical protein